MARRKLGKQSIRKLQVTRGSYLVSLPVEIIRKFKWKERQKVVITRQGNKMMIADWKPKKKRKK